ncbi:MAG: GNAT family N-acetyltransferase, partial [Actinobacteria bacterium]|nr:GNAT family N-acetyltransferase [Actinomycetota bacterium]
GWIERQMERYETDGFGLWVIELNITGEILGNCGPVVQFVDDRREVELGWHVKRSHWGRGIAPEAAAASAAYAMNDLGQERLISIIRPVNRPSARVAEKIGMTVEKQADYKGLLHDIYVLEKGSD